MISCLASILEHSTTLIFWSATCVGVTLFVLRVLMTLITGDFDVDDGSLDSELHDSHHDIPSFKLFTLHSLAGFCMMFGLIGLACSEQFCLSYIQTYSIAALSGIATMVLTACIVKSALRFQDKGAVFNLHKTIGLVGTVYQRIPAHGQGKITVVVQGISRELLAQARDKKPIESFKLVKVVAVADHEIVEVVEITRDAL